MQPKCPLAADEEFDQLCFDYGIELDDVVRVGEAQQHVPLRRLASIRVLCSIAAGYRPRRLYMSLFAKFFDAQLLHLFCRAASH